MELTLLQIPKILSNDTSSSEVFVTLQSLIINGLICQVQRSYIRLIGLKDSKKNIREQ